MLRTHEGERNQLCKCIYVYIIHYHLKLSDLYNVLEGGGDGNTEGVNTNPVNTYIQ